ncbi:uncharacterized protein LOC110078051 isoform X2 [Pogona vitticeps]
MPKRSACTSSAVLSMGCWLLVTFCLNLPSSLLAHSIYTRGLVANVSNWWESSEDLMEAAGVALQQFNKKGFQCILHNIPTENPKNEEKIGKACMAGKSMPGSCSSEENNTVDEAACINTIYNILNTYAAEINDPDLSNAIYHMMKTLKPEKPKISEQRLSSPQDILNESFEMDMKQCKLLLAFQQLAETIHRCFSYQMSLEM